MDAGLLFRYFEANGWALTSDAGQADLLLIGTCGFSQDVEETCLDLVSQVMKRVKPSATVVAFGCLPGINESALTSRFRIVPLVRSKLSKLDEIIGARVPIGEVDEVNVIDDYVDRARNVFSPSDRLRVRLKPSLRNTAMTLASWLTRYRVFSQWDESQTDQFNIRVAAGCLSECSYCAIRHALGPVRSKPLDAVKQEFEAGLRSGHTRFRLIAEDVGVYGHDCDSTVIDLLTMLFDHAGDFKLSWDDFQPEWLLRYSAGLIPLLSRNAGRLGYIAFPIQSGSDRILRMMKRNYSAGDVANCLRVLQDACPGLLIDTHIMIGFPGESREDFAQTLGLLEQVRFRRPLPFVYTDRPGTEASEMPNKVSLFVKAVRLCQFRRKIAALHASAKR